MEITGTDPGHYLRSIDADDVRDTMIALDEIIRAALVERSRDLWQERSGVAPTKRSSATATSSSPDHVDPKSPGS